MNIQDLADNSESSDEDYVPEGTNAELPSEEESDGDLEDPLSDSEEVNKGSRKRQRKQKRTKKKHKTVAKGDPAEEQKDEKKEEQNKQKTANLWADFMKDTGFKTRAERSQTSKQTASDDTSASTDKLPEEAKPDKLNSEATETVQPKKKTVTEIYKFAGEEIEIEKEVNASSTSQQTASASRGRGRKPAGGGRIGSFLNQLGKGNKINTLEKSKLDWDKFKKEENIEDELQAYGKSKDGYLEKQDFLNRADLRRFEIEKEIRNSLRTNRMNNVNM